MYLGQYCDKDCASHSVMSCSLWPNGLLPTRLLCPWSSPGRNTEVGSHSLLQGIFPTQGLNLCLLHCRWSFYCLSHRHGWSDSCLKSQTWLSDQTSNVTEMLAMVFLTICLSFIKYWGSCYPTIRNFSSLCSGLNPSINSFTLTCY